MLQSSWVLRSSFKRAVNRIIPELEITFLSRDTQKIADIETKKTTKCDMCLNKLKLSYYNTPVNNLI